ncbi:MAG: carboxymuconolactone decarboxylase family protein [Candidatus Limnocylindrales bacterium]
MTDAIRSSYLELLGSVPLTIEARLALAERSGRQGAVEAIEAMRRSVIMDSPLGRKGGQLVHFGQLLALGKEGPARLHARAARRAGASLAELVGVAELALITGGMPSYGLGVAILSELAEEELMEEHDGSPGVDGG